jgi:hypothetical protein
MKFQPTNRAPTAPRLANIMFARCGPVNLQVVALVKRREARLGGSTSTIVVVTVRRETERRWTPAGVTPARELVRSTR